MKERPILFSEPMVKAILDGRKTQTRRAVKSNPSDIWLRGDGLYGMNDESGNALKNIKCPYGSVGDRLWVRESFYVPQYKCENLVDGNLWYSADGLLGNEEIDFWKKKPSLYMPREYSRIDLEITGIRVERLNNITEKDAIAEGIDICLEDIHEFPPAKELISIMYYKNIWESINGPGSWLKNPWVWVIEFRRVMR